MQQSLKLPFDPASNCPEHITQSDSGLTTSQLIAAHNGSSASNSATPSHVADGHASAALPNHMLGHQEERFRPLMRALQR